jgi:hypothetical protein
MTPTPVQPTDTAATADRRTNPPPSPPEPVAVTPAFGPIPAIHIARPSSTRTYTVRGTWRATVRAARTALRRTDRRNHD